MKNIDIGSHIYVQKTGYTHHGIYVEAGHVIHYSGLSDGLTAGPIEHTSIEAFLNDGDLNIRNYKNPKYTGIEAVKRARSRLGENKYDILTNNCEHFCNWVITGKSHSDQVEAMECYIDMVLPSATLLLNARKIKTNTMPEILEAYLKTKAASHVIKKSIPIAANLIPISIPAYAIYKVFKWIKD